MPTHQAVIEQLIQERDEARFMARAAHDFIQEGCFADDIPAGDPGTPEFELYVKKHVYQELVLQNPWVRESE